MGVTIHYEGQLKSLDALDELLARTRVFAEEQYWTFEIIDDVHKRLERFIADDDPELDGEEQVYEGPVQGIRLLPHPDCEPFTLEFDSHLFFQDYTKTQFAGASIHRKLVELLGDLEPLFATLKVMDEGEYWTSRDENLLQDHFKQIEEVINEQYPNAQRKVRTSTGRLIDVIT
jgi:hypothetical protein